jgi:hypothetical protein
MSQIHVLKRTNTEVILKCYGTEAQGATIDILLDSADVTGTNEVFTEGTCSLTIKAVYWGCKKDKHLDITRIVPAAPTGVHSHYFLLNAGYYEYKGFVDNTYSTSGIRLVGDGLFHCILILGKNGWKTKIEMAEFGAYDDPTQVGQ